MRAVAFAVVLLAGCLTFSTGEPVDAQAVMERADDFNDRHGEAGTFVGLFAIDGDWVGRATGTVENRDDMNAYEIFAQAWIDGYAPVDERDASPGDGLSIKWSVLYQEGVGREAKGLTAVTLGAGNDGASARGWGTAGSNGDGKPADNWGGLYDCIAPRSSWQVSSAEAAQIAAADSRFMEATTGPGAYAYMLTMGGVIAGCEEERALWHIMYGDLAAMASSATGVTVAHIDANTGDLLGVDQQPPRLRPKQVATLFDGAVTAPAGTATAHFDLGALPADVRWLEVEVSSLPAVQGWNIEIQGPASRAGIDGSAVIAFPEAGDWVLQTEGRGPLTMEGDIDVVVTYLR